MTGVRPRFTIVSAVYNVEPYLPEFIASIEAQRFDLRRLEVIVVDDGSNDRSQALLEAWATRRPGLVTVLTKPNGGQGSARNLGLRHATGEWVTFTDPDDMLGRDFFRVADQFASAHPDVELMAGKPLILEDASGRISDAHARRSQYDGGNRRVDLDLEPNVFASATVSLFRLDSVREQGLRYDQRIRPNFEDGHFAACYLLNLPKPVMGVLRDAIYCYRKRAAGDSSLQRSWADPRRYTDVFRYGYLDVIETARARSGPVPPWLQHVLIYELSWYLSEDEKLSTTIQIAEDVVPTFHDFLCAVVGQLDPNVVVEHKARRLQSVWIDVLAHGCRPHPWHSPTVSRTKLDAEAGLQRIAYRYVGAPPVEEFRIDGQPVEAAYGKTMSHQYYGRSLMEERIAWLPVGGLEVRLDGRPLPIRAGAPNPRRVTRPASRLGRLARYRALPKRHLLKAVMATGRRWRTRLITAPVRLAAALPPYRPVFRDAWVLMDRVPNADDNGERLFEHLRASRPDINAWFVLEKGVPDWERMRAAGTNRLVAHNSFRWKMLMLNCRWLLSSHVDIAIVKPPALKGILDQPRWKYAFLQHGVIKDDLSRWLNRKDIDLFVVSTVAELELVTADGTGYRFTTRETRNTGLPRFDRLLAKGGEVAPDDRDLVIVAPTWRTWLTDPLDLASQRYALRKGLWDSEYSRRWDAILRSPEIATAAAARGWRVAFMPHPNLQPVLSQMALPAHVEALTFAGSDVQGLYGRCALLVTDYSSVAFNAAYLDRPVVYYQFDRVEVMSGAHLGRKGYFEYERDGFGPVVTDAAAAINAIVAAIEHGARPTPEYQARIDGTFVDRDGGACARVVAAVEELSSPFDRANLNSA